MVGLKVPPPVRTSFGRGQAMVRCLSTRTTASVLEATVIQMARMPRQGGGRPSSTDVYSDEGSLNGKSDGSFLSLTRESPIPSERLCN
ncbi:hypothetical protein AVEN_265163-1 [Araneus ventricosus]|uniref:Uncharacterized protein n=1 Tax=Araneus ventricosus TaxID=182803 RepID=A0A4Y2CPM3_ARAVE|nr:hypothetical protein AVEN_265163-1 [Araneus ventricosus]